jgi:hypothetical protein
VLWLIQLAQQIHEILSTKSPLSNDFKDSYALWIQPFSAVTTTATGATSRGDELALSLLSAWATTERYVPWSEESQGSNIVNWETNQFTSQLDTALVTKLSNIPHSSAGGGKNVFKGPEKASAANAHSAAGAGEENSHQTIVNLTARLIGAILGTDSSLSCRILSKALTRLPHDTLLPICFSGPISRFLGPSSLSSMRHLLSLLCRCIMDPFFLCKSNNRERSTLLTSFILVPSLPSSISSLPSLISPCPFLYSQTWLLSQPMPSLIT